jgi:hypothetical protein
MFIQLCILQFQFLRLLFSIRAQEFFARGELLHTNMTFSFVHVFAPTRDFRICCLMGSELWISTNDHSTLKGDCDGRRWGVEVLVLVYALTHGYTASKDFLFGIYTL